MISWQLCSTAFKFISSQASRLKDDLLLFLGLIVINFLFIAPSPLEEKNFKDEIFTKVVYKCSPRNLRSFTLYVKHSKISLPIKEA